MIFKGQNILIVEDNFMSYKLMEAHLKRSNLNIVHAEDGLKAIELFKSVADICLILMDIQLPGMSGLDVTREIKKIRPTIPIIATTANAFDEDKLACEKAGCDDFISKPIDFTLLFELIEKYLNEC